MVKTLELSCYAIFTGTLGWCEKSLNISSPYARNLIAEMPKTKDPSKVAHGRKRDAPPSHSENYVGQGSTIKTHPSPLIVTCYTLTRNCC